jgi:hypothetical protein
MLLGRVIAAAAGIFVIQAVVRSALLTIVVPRGEPTRIARYTLLSVRAGYDLLGRIRRAPERRDRALARFGPSALIGLVLVWALASAVAFVPLYWAAGQMALEEAVYLSLSSLTTLGFARPSGGEETVLAFAEALLGLGLVALLISYLPTIYTLFSRREAQIVKLDVRAGSPPTALEMLARFERIGWLEDVGEGWASWEDWFVELEESHTSHPVLVFFRSQRPRSSWITGAGAVLDTMALVVAVVDVPAEPQMSVSIRAGFMALRAIAGFYGVDFDPDPAPNDPISITRADFDALCAELAGAGVALRPDREQAWRDYAGWRVNYDVPLLALCELYGAPPSPWSSDRSARFHQPTLFHPHWRVEPLENPPSW